MYEQKLFQNVRDIIFLTKSSWNYVHLQWRSRDIDEINELSKLNFQVKIMLNNIKVRKKGIK